MGAFLSGHLIVKLWLNSNCVLLASFGRPSQILLSFLDKERNFLHIKIHGYLFRNKIKQKGMSGRFLSGHYNVKLQQITTFSFSPGQKGKVLIQYSASTSTVEEQSPKHGRTFPGHGMYGLGQRMAVPTNQVRQLRTYMIYFLFISQDQSVFTAICVGFLRVTDLLGINR